MNVQRLLGLAATLTACGQRANPGVVTASEFRLVDGDAKRASLALENGAPAFTLFDKSGKPKLRNELDRDGRPRVVLFGEDASPAAVLEVDDKGSHVLFVGPDKRESYLFQKTDGTAGIVLGNDGGRHRAEMKLAPDGNVDLTLFDADGKPSFSVTVTKDGTIRR